MSRGWEIIERDVQCSASVFSSAQVNWHDISDAYIRKERLGPPHHPCGLYESLCQVQVAENWDLARIFVCRAFEQSSANCPPTGSPSITVSFFALELNIPRHLSKELSRMFWYIYYYHSHSESHIHIILSSSQDDDVLRRKVTSFNFYYFINTFPSITSYIFAYVVPIYTHLWILYTRIRTYNHIYVCKYKLNRNLTKWRKEKENSETKTTANILDAHRKKAQLKIIDIHLKQQLSRGKFEKERKKNTLLLEVTTIIIIL